MDLVVRSYWKGNGETFAVVRYPNTGYKSLKHMQDILMNRWRNKKVHLVQKTYDGIIHFTHRSPIAVQVTLG
jgi:hypothetical protein